MRIIENTTEFYLEQKCAIAIGKFDGIHLGHRKLLDGILKQKTKGMLTTVFTFDTSAAAFFCGESKELMTREEKREAFAKMGIDVLIEFPLNRQTAAIEPETFVETFLVKQMKATYICAGQDISFGNKGAGDYALLDRLSRVFGYAVEIIDKVAYKEEEISSTRVRNAVREGRMEETAQMLGNPYFISGTVEHGRKLGRTLGMPTANILTPEEKLLPPNGVYFSRVKLDGVSYPGISNVGCKPTVSDKAVMGIETYLYDFTGDIYGRDITVELLKFKRPEMKFGSIEELKKQMQSDIDEGRQFIL